MKKVMKNLACLLVGIGVGYTLKQDTPYPQVSSVMIKSPHYPLVYLRVVDQKVTTHVWVVTINTNGQQTSVFGVED